VEVNWIQSGDGSPTLFSPAFGEAYHNQNGARGQAERLFVGRSGIQALKEARVLEVGFGLGLNFFAARRVLCDRGGRLFYLAYEPHPVPVSVLEAFVLACTLAEPWLVEAWEAADGYVYEDHCGVLEVRFFPFERGRVPEGWADAVFFDPFSPRANPEAWSKANLRRAFVALRPGGVLVSYAVAGWVRRALAEVGFEVEKLPGELGKKAWLRARRPGSA